MNRGCDDNKMFLKLEDLGQDYVIRLKSNRKLLYHNKWTMAAELRNRRKERSGPMSFTRAKISKPAFLMLKFRLLHPVKISIWCLFTELQNIQCCLPLIRKSSQKMMWFAWQGPTFHAGKLKNIFAAKNCWSSKANGFLLLLPTGKGYLWHTILCKRGRQALIPAGLI